MERVKVYHNNGNPNAQSRGLFAKALLENNPTLPAEEEGRLADPALRENFIERVFLMRRWKDLMKEGINADKLIEFHAQHKLSLMAHHPMSYKELGSLLSDLKNKDIHTLANDYFSRLMRGFTYKASRAKNTNVLQHCSGYLKNYLDKSDKEELQNIIQRYYQSEIPLIVPITLLSHYFRKYPNDYMSKQTFLKPYPNELSLRNSL